ncbi:unnamed protein product [Mycetohabitans rhizoxinica HKI 454]|uniref:Uncharacterized protein n=1 Tax=Mycetohabitans rhizoxinica (strain DSM 19002 / CIP 109453 / HKI 454) TaxID=882378 RepID=E5AML8_MYCRK|nr:unnamed protein product [Mycetohabitans rhizoxinica HKI 454]
MEGSRQPYAGSRANFYVSDRRLEISDDTQILDDARLPAKGD